MNAAMLICGANWLGDSVMSMPAVQLLREERPSVRLSMLVKPGLVPLWRLHGAVDDVIELRAGVAGARTAASHVRERGPAEAVIFPNSFRSALVPFLAGVRARTGRKGHWRRWILTRLVDAPTDPERRHQAWEYARLVGVGGGCTQLPLPSLSLPPDVVTACRERIGEPVEAGVVAMLPGAARGPSKRWPEEAFVQTGRDLNVRTGCRILVLGSAAEAGLCARVGGALGSCAVDLSGTTSLPELASLLSLCRLVIANDSGGMHLAAAVGTPVVALFGMTDPAVTGPLGDGHRVLAPEGVHGSRDIPRDSGAARRALAGIAPAVATGAALEILDRQAGSP